MRGKNILVTGASRGIGRGVAEYFLQKGANVVLVARDGEKLRELQQEYPDTAYPYPFDLENIADIESIFEFCKEKGLKLHGMLHAAGISISCPVKSFELSEAERMFKINYFAYVALTKYFLRKKYSENDACMLVMSSIASFQCEKAMSQYAASKSAINAHTKVAAREGGKRRIRANAIAPAFVDTDMTQEVYNVIENFEQSLEKQMLGVIPVSQIAYLVEFLMSDRATYITGAVIPVTGGSF